MSATALPHPMTRRTSGTRTAGIIVFLVAALIASGGAALVGVHRGADADGFHTTGAGTLATPTAAFVSDGVDLGDDPTWLFRNGHLGTLRVDAAGSNGKPVFVGIARESQVDAYLRGVAVDRVTDFDAHPLTVTTDRRPGGALAAAPVTQRFWARSSTGSGPRSISWPVESGSWSVVVMNADGSPGVRARVDVGVKVPLILWVGVGLLVAGAALGVTGATLVYLGRSRR